MPITGKSHRFGISILIAQVSIISPLSSVQQARSQRWSSVRQYTHRRILLFSRLSLHDSASCSCLSFTGARTNGGLYRRWEIPCEWNQFLAHFEWMGDLMVLNLFQQYFSYIRMMEGWLWLLLAMRPVQVWTEFFYLATCNHVIWSQEC